MLDKPRYSMEELWRCAEREIRRRRRVYGNRVMANRMTQQEATRELAMMAWIAEHLAELAAKERLL